MESGRSESSSLRTNKIGLFKFVDSLIEDGKIIAVVVEDKVEAAVDGKSDAVRVVGKGTNNDEIPDDVGMDRKVWAPMTSGLVLDTEESAKDKLGNFFQLSYRVVRGSSIERCCAAEDSKVM